MSVSFEPRDEDEKNWVSLSFIKDYELKNTVEPEFLFFSNNEVRVSDKIKMHVYPFTTPWRIYCVAIIYILRLYDDARLNKDIAEYELFSRLDEDAERTRRTLLKSFSKNSHVQAQENFQRQMFIIRRYTGKGRKAYIRALLQLMSFQVLTYYKKKGRNHREIGYVKLTDYGKKIVKLHRDSHFIV